MATKRTEPANSASTATPTATATADGTAEATADADAHAHAEAAPLLQAGKVKTLNFDEGDTVRFRVRNDEAEEVHVHGYDISKELEPNKTETVSFKATITGHLRDRARAFAHAARAAEGRAVATRGGVASSLRDWRWTRAAVVRARRPDLSR